LPIRSFAETPVHTLAPALAELATREWDQGTEHFQPTTFQVSQHQRRYRSPNVIPGELKARFNLRYSPVQSIAGLQRTVEDLLRRHQVRYTLECTCQGSRFIRRRGFCAAQSAMRWQR